MFYDFSIQTHGKWILAGEHAVLRGSPAIVFPIASRSLTLSYQNQSTQLDTEFHGIHGNDMHVLFWGVIERALAITQRVHSDITGKFTIDNNIPLGAGMGASAALCVAIGRWFLNQGWIEHDALHEFSRELENLFHVESSGVDIAVMIANKGLFFERSAEPKAVEMKWQPTWYLSHTAQVAITSNCVKKVKDLYVQNPTLAKRIDQDMQDSVQSAATALKLSKEDGLSLLAAAINKAHVCFAQWGLAGGKVEPHIHQLLEAGALAAKPTGAGDGGFVLSLWSEPPTKELPFEMLAV